MEKETNKTVKIGDVFFIDISGLCTWTYNEEMSFFCSFGNLVDQDERMLIVVKYIGNGIVEEMLTGEKILIDKFYRSDMVCEQDHDLTCYVCANYFEEKKKNANVKNVSDYIEKLESIKENAFNYPFVFCTLDSKIYEIDDETKDEYLEISDSIRKQKILSLKKRALKKSKKFIGKVTEFINNFDINDELTGDKMLDEAYFENKLFDFKRKKLQIKDNI